jgi:hypothetical protein
MPHSAIETGTVDRVMRCRKSRRAWQNMAEEKALKLPPEEGPQPAQAVKQSHGQAETRRH